ncbi:MAG: response regulator transcription factor [Marinifilaceae bacterium]|nr:response regulator transcription factor [Marinifilaceae bacterium]
MSNTPKILVVDDEEDLCEILRFNLESEGYIVSTANSAEEAMKLNIIDYDLILLDVMMGEISGFKMAKILKQNPQTASIPIIFTTAKDTENDIITGLTIGADDYISKPFSLREVCLRVNAVLRRISHRNQTGATSTNDILTYKELVLNTSKKSLFINNEQIDLTKKEFEILYLLLNNRGRLFTREEILDRVWRDEAIVTTRTIDVNITRLRKKLKEYGSNITARSGFGYRFED